MEKPQASESSFLVTVGHNRLGARSHPIIVPFPTPTFLSVPTSLLSSVAMIVE